MFMFMYVQIGEGVRFYAGEKKFPAKNDPLKREGCFQLDLIFQAHPEE